MSNANQSRATDELQEEIISLGPWHHDVQVTPEVSTSVSLQAPKGTYSSSPSFINPHEHLANILSKIYPGGLEGRTFLDCACNCGGYSFSAKDLGASECFGFDARKHWVDQANFLSENRAWSTKGMRFEELDLYDLPKLGLEPFDITLFKGIFYHLPDPIAGLKLAADLTREVIVVNTATLNDVPDGMLAINEEGTEKLMSGVHGLAWFPTGPHVLAQILKWMGFTETRLVFWVDHKTGLSRQRGRMEIIASRKEGLLQNFKSLEGQTPTQGEIEKPHQQIEKQLRQHNNQLRRERDNLQQQLGEVINSRTWRLLTAQRKLRLKAEQTLGSLKRRS